MGVRPLTDEELRQALRALRDANGNQSLAAESLGLARTTFQSRVSLAKEKGVTLSRPKVKAPEPVKETPKPSSGLELLLKRAGDQGVSISPRDHESLSEIEALRSKGLNISRRSNGCYVLDKAPQPGFVHGAAVTIYSDKNNRFKFGAVGDTHIGSKFHREDVMRDLYDLFAARGVQHVFNTGNWIEGVARFNQHELTAYGMEEQVQLLIDLYPQRPGITTYAVTGDDHEGWWSIREGIDIGRFAQQRMREAGRQDWVGIGFMESHVRLVNSNTGKEAIMAVVHPGGGSSYATSYSVQKIIESLEGGEKPDIGLYGHYHKLWAGNIRNVWVVQTGTAQDQTIFMRKKRLEAHVGGVYIECEQDPETGAITAFTPDMRRYFTRGYYQGRWGHGVSLTLPSRGR